MGEKAFTPRTRYRRAGCAKRCPSGSGGGGWIPLGTRGWPPTSCACARVSLGKEEGDVGSIEETFRRSPVGQSAHPVECGQQPEASSVKRISGRSAAAE